LLGREQIADSPTAVGELFKNALDAGASNTWIDYWEDKNLLSIRDDGLGMRPEDVTDKWLVLATDSSHRTTESNSEWAKFANKQQQQWLEQKRYGEKGIGRLSVSILGRLVLLWTVWGEGKDKTGTLCLVHWHLFRHPRKLFEDLPIPVTQHKTPATQADINKLFASLRESPEIKALLEDADWDKTLQDEIREDLKHPLSIADVQKKGTKLPWENGTSFHIQGVSDEVPVLFEKRNKGLKPEEDRTTDQLKAYHAFSAFWDPFHDHSGERDFHLHPRINGKPLPDTNRYWLPEDFTRCDHHIRIEVSSDGFAQGTLNDHGQKEFLYQKQLVALPSRYSSPGAFVVEIGYLQGTRSLSRLSDDDYHETATRLLHSGGFSIYVNNVRIQPYGTVESDFAGFEARRLKNAGRYYFGSRRMFGGIFLPNPGDSNLREKAGREGFVANGASRGLRLWIQDLFIDLADSRYGSNAERPDKTEALRRKKQADLTRKRLEGEKKSFLKEVKDARKGMDRFVEDGKSLMREIRNLENSEHNAKPGTHLVEWEKKLVSIRALARRLYETPDIPPVGVVLDGDESATVELYRSRRSEMILALNKEIENLSSRLEDASGRYLDRKTNLARLEKRIKSGPERYLREIRDLIKPVVTQNSTITEKITKFGETEFEALESLFEERLSGLTPEAIADDSSNENARTLERALGAIRDHFEETTKPNIKQLANELNHLMENTSASVLVQEFADKITRLQEREAFLVEMAQLGLITETATHEHEHHVQQVRSHISGLRKRLSGADLTRLESLASSFDIVDARMRMFDPLLRRSGGQTASLTGGVVADFLREHFSDAFDNETIEITPHFLKTTFSAIKKPVFLGAIHNIVHNGLYWCRRGESEIPKLRLSAAGNKISISDNGPGVSPRDADRIFDPGFTRRPYGRGLGLYIARQALDGIGYQLEYHAEGELETLEGACFVIQPRSLDE